MSEIPFIRRLGKIFQLDLRSLALFRIALALLILTNLGERSQALVAHYTDSGVLPRGFFGQGLFDPWVWSIHFASGQTFFQVLLFLTAVVAAFFLAIGYRTRLAVIVSWLLELSIINRNWLLNTSGDKEFCMLLFWSMFLPLGAYYSVDRALNSANEPLPKTIFSGATVAYTIQIFLVYWFAWASKSDPVWWREGTAVSDALSIDYMATRFGKFLLNFPSLLVFFNFTTLGVELLAPFLLFVPWGIQYCRGIAIILFILLHAGFGLSLRLGVFAFVAAIAWLAFIPSEFWNYLARRLQRLDTQAIQIYYDRESVSTLKFIYLLRTFLLLPKLSVLPAQEHPELLTHLQTHKSSWLAIDTHKHLYSQFQALQYLCQISPIFKPLRFIFNIKLIKWVAKKIYYLLARASLLETLNFRPLIIRSSRLINSVTLFLLGCVILWNFQTFSFFSYKVSQPIYIVDKVLGLDQNWSVFAPRPFLEDGWHVIPGQLKDGTTVDLFRDGTAVSWEKPELISELFPTMYWLKYMELITQKANAAYRGYYAQYLCRDWNAKHPVSKQLDSLEIYYMLEKTLPNYQKPKIEKILLYKQRC